MQARTRELLAICHQVDHVLRRRGVTTATERVAHVVAFVRDSFPYVDDTVSTPVDLGRTCPDYGRYPIESLADGHGDSDCRSILLASMLVTFGYRTALVETAESGGRWEVGVALDDYAGLLDGDLAFVGPSGQRYLRCSLEPGDSPLGIRLSDDASAVLRVIELSCPEAHRPTTGPPDSPA